jgi:hypothetical protein
MLQSHGAVTSKIQFPCWDAENRQYSALQKLSYGAVILSAVLWGLVTIQAVSK